MNEERAPSQELLIARRALEGMARVELLQDWTWYEGSEKWILYSRLSPDVRSDGPIPSTTDWYVLVDPTYPWGFIKFHPAKEQGLVQTFPHQSYNGAGKDEVPWRDGDLCLDTSVRALGHYGYDSEPYEAHKRLRWRFQRALDWLSKTSRGELVLPGDPFELPQFPHMRESSITVAFSEDAASFSIWQGTPENAGLVEFLPLHSESDILIIKSFRSIDGRELLVPSWGQALGSTGNDMLIGIWLRLNSTPTLDPWQAPSTWQELREACRMQGVEINDLLKPVVKSIRDGKRHIALIGFPIPAEVGEALCQMHWQALLLPILSWGSRTAKGFRPNETGYWQRDRTEILHGKATTEWLMSENWNVQQISTRGKLPETLTSKRILLLGAGAVGAVMAELLVRAGVQKLIVMDGDRLEAGNLVRHTLGLDQLKMPKATALVRRLNSALPHVSAEAININFPPVKEADKSQIQRGDVILDCTGSDEVLHYLEIFPWDGGKLFVSISMGLQAQRLYCFASRGDNFPHATFREMVNPWLEQELNQYAGQELPREGVGCWHPIFPARVDDVWMMSSIAVKHIESVVAISPLRPELVVFEQAYKNGVFAGIHRVDPKVTHV